MNYIYRVLDYMAWFWFMEWLILVYILNRIIHGRSEIWNLSSRVHIRYLTGSLRSLVRYRCEHSRINSISPRDHVLFSLYINTWRVCQTRVHKSFIGNLARHSFSLFDRNKTQPQTSKTSEQRLASH